MQYMIYFFIAVSATIIGSMTGMGGGVIMKPLMDVLHDFDVETIGLISSVTVFSMSAVSIGKQMKEKSRIPFPIALPLSMGSVIGGYAGQAMLENIIEVSHIRSIAVILQNLALGILVLGVIVYMYKKDRIPGKELSGYPACFLTGGFLGICSSFLGIGGGPMNVALIIYLFSMDTKTASRCSLVTIFFAQLSKLITAAAGGSFVRAELSVAPIMIAGAVLGSLIGAEFHKKLSDKAIERAFCIVQWGVLGLTIFNIAGAAITMFPTAHVPQIQEKSSVSFFPSECPAEPDNIECGYATGVCDYGSKESGNPVGEKIYQPDAHRLLCAYELSGRTLSDKDASWRTGGAGGIWKNSYGFCYENPESLFGDRTPLSDSASFKRNLIFV